jgi:hypothetical protein
VAHARVPATSQERTAVENELSRVVDAAHLMRNL